MTTVEQRRELRRRLDETAAWWEAHGYRPSRGRCCPRLVAGRHCLRDGCICQRHPHTTVLDHPHIWVKDGRHVFTSEPYSLDADDLAAYRADLATLGLVVTVEPYSPHCPGQTYLLMVRPAR